MNDLTTLRQQLTDNGYCYLGKLIPSDQIDRIRLEVTRDVWEHSLKERPKGYVPGFCDSINRLLPF